jgi:hypothetical protein
MRDISIRRVNLGWIVDVGCQQFVFTDKARMVEAFNDYMTDEESARKNWCDQDNKNVLREASGTEYATRATEPPSIVERY